VGVYNFNMPAKISTPKMMRRAEELHHDQIDYRGGWKPTHGPTRLWYGTNKVFRITQLLSAEILEQRIINNIDAVAGVILDALCK